MPNPHTRRQAPLLAPPGLSKSLSSLVDEFCDLLSLEWEIPDNLRILSDQFLEGVGSSALHSKARRSKIIIRIINEKFRLNRGALQTLYNQAARERVFFDPPTKAKLADIFNRQDVTQFYQWVDQSGLPGYFKRLIAPITPRQTLEHLHDQLEHATINRSDAREGIQAERKQSVLRSLFGSWLYGIVETRIARSCHIGLPEKRIPDLYFDLLQREYPDALKRTCGGEAIMVPLSWWQKYTLDDIRSSLFEILENAYQEISNHSYCAILFEFPEREVVHGQIWELIGDLTVFAERMRSEPLQNGFFHPDKIAEQTKRHISLLDERLANFEAFQFGFAYKDCFVICAETLTDEGADSSISSALLLFEKHQADETPIPCPSCWSLNVRGNSYPVFGVKSWECQNSLCPERSAFDRGNRYSALSVLRAEASRDSETLIPEESLREWKLDLVGSKDSQSLLKMFVRHYSLPGDTLKCLNWSNAPKSLFERRLINDTSIPDQFSKRDVLSDFQQNPFFHRYLNVANASPEKKYREIDGTPEWLSLYEGSCLSVLPQLEAETVDGAVTSPPYYNARDYSVWPNLYCYLYDMKVAASGVFHALKPGGYYLFNIFDYFDNDNIMAFSALGKRRLPLAAYMTQIFRRCGFLIEGNIVWHKGEIEGKRNYNQGNRGPFLQLPLNTWEHILILRKPGTKVPNLSFPQTIYRRPVVKWVNGENRHGHSAPFPECVPMLLCSRLHSGSTVLDPFAGSLTTALAATKCDQKAVAIELHESYCELGLKRIAEIESLLPLFGSP